MAHIIKIPIGFEFRPRRALWDAVAAEILGWAPSESASTERHFRVRVNERGTPYLVEVPWWGLPRQALMLLSDKSSVLPDIRGYSADLLVCSISSDRGTNKWPEADPWIMREEFLRLKQKTKDLVAFLNKWGVWGTTPSISGCREELHTPPRGRTRLGGPLSTIDPDKVPNICALGLGVRSANTYVLPSDMWEYQRRSREGLKSPACRWLVEAQKLFAATPRPEYPHLFLVSGTCQEAIRTTITLDLLRKVKFRICARPDCGSPFEIKNRHRREYCCQYCAHIESVRRQRRSAKRDAKQLSKGVTYAKRQGAR
jgi:hypothetical protein